jgi:hypothetical protein
MPPSERRSVQADAVFLLSHITFTFVLASRISLAGIRSQANGCPAELAVEVFSQGNLGRDGQLYCVCCCVIPA